MRRGRKIFLVGVAAALTVPVVYKLTHPSAGETLTAERLAEARERWAERGPKSYVIEVDVRGLTYRIEVRDGREVVGMTVDGRPAAASALEHWTVEGMFGFLAQELSNLRRVEAAYGVTDPDSVILRAEFDGKTGYPSSFLRHVLGQNRSVEWRVLSLEPR
jgi:hypothetical protein